MIAPLRRRIKKTVTLDRDNVNPDVLSATMNYLTRAVEVVAHHHRAAVDWNTFKITIRHRRNGEQRFTAKARVL